MKKKLNVYWYKIKDGQGNFGDELNHYLISKLSGCDVRQIIIPSSGFDYIYKALSFTYYKVIATSSYLKLIRQFFINEFIVAIGSVIAVTKSKKAKIWGSGIIKKSDKINDAKFYAVRGKYTQKRLKELGYEAPSVIGDPALLLPLVYKPNRQKTFKLGVIPHHIHYNELKNKLKNKEVLIIDLTDSIENIIEQLCSCERIISTSLHGIIVSHAYNIPSLWFDFGGKPLFGDNIKFADYFSSVGIEKYAPFKFSVEELRLNDVINIFNDNKSISFINYNLFQIQKQLINSAPFNILKKYKSWH